LGDEVTVVDVSNEDGRGLFPGEHGVALPVGWGADESLSEAGVGDECVKKILGGPDHAFFIDSGYVA
jgi:hypothetical protein